MKRDTNTPNIKDLKEHYFFFVTLIPGVGDKNNRTYDFKQKIAMNIAKTITAIILIYFLINENTLVKPNLLIRNVSICIIFFIFNYV